MDMLNDKRIRQLVIAVLLVILALGLLSLVSTALQLIVPLALILGGGFAFYKVVLQGRDEPEVMEDELAEQGAQAQYAGADIDAAYDCEDANDQAAQERLSAVEQARSQFVDAATPAQEILDSIKERKQRLHGDDAP